MKLELYICTYIMYYMLVLKFVDHIGSALGRFKMRPARAPSLAARAERSSTPCTASLEPKRTEISKAMDSVPKASIKKKKDQPGTNLMFNKMLIEKSILYNYKSL